MLKQAVYSWDRSGNRLVYFEPGSKAGIVLGKNCVITRIRSDSQAFWKGIEVGSTILKVNGLYCEDISVKSALKEAAKSSKKYSILLKVPSPPGSTEKKAETQGEGLPKVSATVISANGWKELSEKSSSATLTPGGDSKLIDDDEVAPFSLPAQTKGIHEISANVISPKCVPDVNEPNFSILQETIKKLQQANLELQQKCTAEVLKRKNECMKKDTKISRLERQVGILQGERNTLRKQINKMKTPEKKKPDLDVALNIIQEDGINSPSPDKFTFHKSANTLVKRSSRLSANESVLSTDVWYGNPTKDDMQRLWKDAKKQAKQRSSVASSTSGLPNVYRMESVGSPTIGAALDAPFYSIYKSDPEMYTEYTDSPRTEANTVDESSTGKNRLSAFSAITDNEEAKSVIVLV